jgi:hypothetical protein
MHQKSAIQSTDKAYKLTVLEDPVQPRHNLPRELQGFLAP